MEGKIVRIRLNVFCLIFLLVFCSGGPLAVSSQKGEADQAADTDEAGKVDEAGEAKAREVIQAAISALGGERYLGMKNWHSRGRLFGFSRGRLSGFVRFLDWTGFDPIKSRHQRGKGKRQEVTIFNLELRKAWKLEGEHTVEEIPEKEIKSWEKSVKRDINVLLKSRLNEEGMHLYYYGPQDISGSGKYEAVEFLDAENDSVVVYFDLENHLPTRLETEFRGSEGILHKQETELSNWHTIEGVHTPMRTDTSVDGHPSEQVHLEEISYNVNIPPEHFLEPQVEKKE